jgi:hypothetical protein
MAARLFGSLLPGMAGKRSDRHGAPCSAALLRWRLRLAGPAKAKACKPGVPGAFVQRTYSPDEVAMLTGTKTALSADFCWLEEGFMTQVVVLAYEGLKVA